MSYRIEEGTRHRYHECVDKPKDVAIYNILDSMVWNMDKHFEFDKKTGMSTDVIVEVNDIFYCPWCGKELET